MDEEIANLAALEAHGRAFLESFGISSVSGVKRTAEEQSESSSAKKRRKNKASKTSSSALSLVSTIHKYTMFSCLEPLDVDPPETITGLAEEIIPAPAPAVSRQPEVVVFAQPGSSSKPALVSKTSQRLFMVRGPICYFCGKLS